MPNNQRFEEKRRKLTDDVHKAMPGHIERISWSREKLLNFQTERLRDILDIAKRKTSFYKDILSQTEISNFTLNDLEKLPIIKKPRLMENWDSFIAAEGINRQIAEDHLEGLRDGKIENPYYNDEFLFVATGGSSGKRGLFVWDDYFLTETVCICYRNLAEREQSKGITEKVKLAVLEAPSYLHGSKHLFTVSFAPNVDVRALSSLDSTEKQITILNDYSPDYLVGFASVIAELAHAQIRGKLNISPRWVSTNSEPLDDEMRQVIKEAWGTWTCNSWGSVEIGLVGMEIPDHVGMIIGEDGVILELVDNQLKPVKDKKDARKLLATSLINRSFPIIRYVIDDVVEFEEENTVFPAYREIKSILGRTDDWFTYEKCRIHPMIFRHVLGQNREIEEYQVIQTERGAEVLIVVSERIDTDKIEDQISTHLIQDGLTEPDLQIKIVDSLPRHPETGKVKRFIALKK